MAATSQELRQAAVTGRGEEPCRALASWPVLFCRSHMLRCLAFSSCVWLHSSRKHLPLVTFMVITFVAPWAPCRCLPGGHPLLGRSQQVSLGLANRRPFPLTPRPFPLTPRPLPVMGCWIGDVRWAAPQQTCCLAPAEVSVSMLGTRNGDGQGDTWMQMPHLQAKQKSLVVASWAPDVSPKPPPWLSTSPRCPRLGSQHCEKW